MARPFLERFLHVQFFGEFLIDRWVINREQLVAALEYQMNRNERFGEIAIRKGFLTRTQVDTLRRQQRQSDLTFGELAIAGGLLTNEQVQQIATFQRRNNVLLGETLLRLNFINEGTLRRELTNFREHQRRFFSDDPPLPISQASAAVIGASLDLTRKMFRRVAGIPIKAGHAVVMRPEEEKIKTGHAITVSIGFSGDESIQFVLSVSQSIAALVASAILGPEEEGPQVDAMTVDAVKEFCNYICGNAVAKIARKGVTVDISPPAHLSQIPEVPNGYQTVAFPVRSTKGGLDLRFHVPLS